MEAESVGHEPLLSWAYADCDNRVYDVSLQWSAKKSFELSVQDITSHNPDLPRPNRIKEYDQSGTQTRAYEVSSYEELNSLHLAHDDATSSASAEVMADCASGGGATWTVAFQPGDLGFHCVEQVVTSLTPGGQAERGGVKSGMILHAIQGIACTAELLDEWKSGNNTFRITFKLAKRCNSTDTTCTCYDILRETEAKTVADDSLLSWAYADCNRLAYYDPLRWSGKKSFELIVQDITSHNADFARPIYIEEYGQSGTKTRAYKASSYGELNSLHRGQDDATSTPAADESATWTVTFQPGDLGFNCIDNVVTSITPGGQAECGGMKPGMMPHAIQGIPFTAELLDERISGNEAFSITFKLEAKCSDSFDDAHTCYGALRTMEAESVGHESLLSWAYADCNPLAYYDPLRWSGKKSFELIVQDIASHNTEFARPINIKEHDQSGTQTRAYKASSFEELNSIHLAQYNEDKDGATWTVTFQPGDLGFDCVDNVVTRLTAGGQAKCGGMEPGMIPHLIQGKPFTAELLDEWKARNQPFSITFQLESDTWHDTMAFYIWEYQRYWPTIGWLRPGLIGAGDPPNYADEDGEQVDPPPETWQIQTSGGTHAEGWEFASAFTRFGQPREYGRGVQGPKDRVRRRRWVPMGGTSYLDLSRTITERKKRKDDALQGVGRQMRALIGSRSIFRNLDVLNLVSWAKLRKLHRHEYQAFLENLPPAECGCQHQFDETDWAVSLPAVADIMYAFRFMVASYGSAFTVDPATQRRKMLQLTGLSEEDSLLQIKEEGETLRPAYAVFVDHVEHRCILTIRGTATVEDALTNTVADPVFDEVLGTYVHGGIRDAAVWLLGEVSTALRSAAAAHPQYTLLITGHSLGAGVAALVTLLIGHQEPDNFGFHSIWGMGFATPCVVTLEVAEGEVAMKNFTTIVCARDAIVRTCVPNIYMLHHEVAMASNRSRLQDRVGRLFGGRLQRYAERRHTDGAETAAQMSGPKCFPVGACIVLADPGEDNARALVAKPASFSKYFVHEDMAADHSTDRYEIGLRCLNSCANQAEAGSSMFFGAMAHHDWGEVEGQLFATELEARQKYAKFSLFVASMVVNPLGEVLAYHGMDEDKGKSRKSEMTDWYLTTCKNEVYGSNSRYACMQHIKFGEVDGWFFDSVKEAREKFKSLSLLKACMIVDNNGKEVAFYGVDCSSRTPHCPSPESEEAKTVKDDMLRWFREKNAMDANNLLSLEDSDEERDMASSSSGSFYSCFSEVDSM